MSVNKSLEQALLAAQQNIEGVGKGSYNGYSKYKYTSAEEMLTACRTALHSAGLTVRRTCFCYDEKLDVTSTVRLAHADSKEHEESIIVFPAIIKKGTPADKAIAAALTTSLSYYLRDLLLLPRSEEFDMDKRDDNQYAPQNVQQQALQPIVQSYTVFQDVPDKLVSLKKMIDEKNCLLEVYGTYAVSNLGDIKLSDAQDLKKFIVNFDPDDPDIKEMKAKTKANLETAIRKPEQVGSDKK